MNLTFSEVSTSHVPLRRLCVLCILEMASHGCPRPEDQKITVMFPFSLPFYLSFRFMKGSILRKDNIKRKQLNLAATSGLET